MGKHTLEIQYDYDFVLIGISSHEKDYRLCWALNNKFGLELIKVDSLEIKGKKQETPSFFSLFTYDHPENFLEYTVVANLSESKSGSIMETDLFGSQIKAHSHNENEFLIPEHKQLNYFFVVKGEVDEQAAQQMVKKIKEIDLILTAIPIDVSQLKSKHNLVF
ncbi:MAG TPA: IPExxxVDY family protein [Bacteroidia bacterium]|nr:IPExxxVDY family protein [Bacteroidia bacterium]